MTAKALPFAGRNERDFDEMTTRIQNSLDLIRKNKRLKATQESLADLAQCSRRTLSLRGWPITELRKIKDSRSNQIKSVEDNPNTPTLVRTETLLIRQVKNYQKQNGELFDRVQGLAEEKARMAVVIDALEHQLKFVREKLEAFERESRKSKLRAV